MNKVKICQLKYVYLAYGTVEVMKLKSSIKEKKKNRNIFNFTEFLLLCQYQAFYHLKFLDEINVRKTQKISLCISV